VPQGGTSGPNTRFTEPARTRAHGEDAELIRAGDHVYKAHPDCGNSASPLPTPRPNCDSNGRAKPVLRPGPQTNCRDARRHETCGAHRTAACFKPLSDGASATLPA
jgi:hypothetical protein